MNTSRLTHRILTLCVVGYIWLTSATDVRAARMAGVVGVIVDDDKPRVTMKAVQYIDDFLDHDVKVFTASEYLASKPVFDATVVITQTGRDNAVSLLTTIYNGSSKAVHSAQTDYNNRVSALILQNRLAMNSAKYALKQLSTEDWRGLVKKFEDDVEELDD